MYNVSHGGPGAVLYVTGSNCPNNQPPAGKCSPGCAVAIHSFGKDCGATLGVVMPNAGDPRKAMIQAFEKRCLAS
jgi:hypothetical protein